VNELVDLRLRYPYNICIMPRRKKFFGGKVSSKSFSHMLGLLFIVGGLTALAAIMYPVFGPDELNVFQEVNESIRAQIGHFIFLLPPLLFLISTHFFGKKRKRLVRPNTTVGAVLIFMSLLILTQSGRIGQHLFDRGSEDFGVSGGVLMLCFMLFIGIILFFDTSLDVVVMIFAKLAHGLLVFFKQHVFRNIFSPGKKEKKEKKKEEKDDKGAFIQDKKAMFSLFGGKNEDGKGGPAPEKPAVANGPNDGAMVMRPLSSSGGTWVYPPISLLQEIEQKAADRGDVQGNAATIERTLESFGIRARVAEVNNGPTVTQYALEITMGTKLSKITSLANDLALALAAPSGQVRIEAPIPGRSMVGIEIPNIRAELVTLKQVLTSKHFKNSHDPLEVPLGLDVSGSVRGHTISKMPHVLIAGTTGSGKSVVLNAWITAMLFRTKPEELRFIMVDPKRVELSVYNGIPHLMTEVIVEPEKILSALKWTVGEMESRYKEFAKVGARNLEGFNEMEGVEKKPYIVFIIDELADLMMFAPGDAEDLITRIAQMARATGIHLILATQRPSVDVITGLMKANIPTRLAFNVSSLVDSRVIIDTPGAEKLMGKGDMLFLPPDQAKPRRMQGPLVTDKEIQDLVSFLKTQAPPVHYTEEIVNQETATIAGKTVGGAGSESSDPHFKSAIEIIMQTDKASASLLQRKLSIGYARAARLIDQLEEAGYIGPGAGSKPREVIRRMSDDAAPVESE